MKNICFVLISVVIFNSGIAQSVSLREETGAVNGVNFKILFPPNWKGKLVMYAHGYEFMGASPRQSSSQRFVQSMKPILDLGFAIAASDYAVQGFAIKEGVNDTEALREYFIRTYGKVDSVFIVGHSMGGGIALSILENFGKNYHGGLPLCPLSSPGYVQARKEFDIYATFNGLFPGVAVSLAEIFDPAKQKPATPFSEMMPKVNAIRKAIIEKDSALGVAFAKKFDLKFTDLPYSLFFNENVLRDLANKAGGNPFDNMNTVYSGFPNDWELNQQVERLSATVSPDTIFKTYDRTGNISTPVVLMHTMYDQLIPPEYAVVNYENMVHQRGKDKYLTVKYTNGQGHCSFSSAQTIEAFNALRHWVSSGIKAKAGPVQ